MLFRRKMWVAVLIVAILFLMLASQNSQKRHVLPQSLSPPTFRATPASMDTVVELTAPPADLTPDPPGKPHTPPPIMNKAKFRRGPADDSQYDSRSCGCPKDCISDVTSSDWFSQRYDPRQQPILRDTNNNFDQDALRWWLGLQRSGNDHTLEEVMSKMFQVISPPTVDHRPHPSLCRRCAVVGNSGNLRDSGLGNLIDSHNSVIRMNKAVTRGFEKDVGNRTTHHFLYPESAVDVARGVSLILLPFKLRDLEWLTSALSTGLIKMTYMRVKERVEADKDKVSVFGYGADKQGNWHHYWEENRYAGAFRKTGVHSADFETQIIHHLAKEGKISLHL